MIEHCNDYLHTPLSLIKILIYKKKKLCIFIKKNMYKKFNLNDNNFIQWSL